MKILLLCPGIPVLLGIAGVSLSTATTLKHHVSNRRAFGLRDLERPAVDASCAHSAITIVSELDRVLRQPTSIIPSVPRGGGSITTSAPRGDFVLSANVPRGGACDDANAAFFGKVGISAFLQAAGLMGVLALGKAGEPILSDFNVPSIFGTSPALWAAFLVVVFASSLVGTFVDGGASAALNQALDPNTTPGDPEWYANLAKPSWNPPGWLFPIMWLIVSKPTQLAAVNTLWSATDGADRGWRLFSYCLHLAMGDAWNKTFFGYQCVGRGVVVISTFYALLLCSAFLFWQADPVAGKLMLPTCGWVTVATALNWSIYLLNDSSKEKSV